MRVLVDIGHPGHVHFYKHVIWHLEREGHQVLISARDKDVTLALLDHYGFAYQTLSGIGRGRWGLLREFLQREWALLRLIRAFDPDVVTEVGGLFIAPVCQMLKKPSIVFTDSEPVPLDRFFTYPFASMICTPECFMRDLGNRHIRYAGYHELAYLHPSYFQPDSTVLRELGVAQDEPYIVLRFVAWRATHDLGQAGFSTGLKLAIVEELSRYGRLFITSEVPLGQALEQHRVKLPPHRIHDVLYYARLFMGDGATMATEAGILGTPAVRSSSLALSMGNFVELMDRYELVYSYYDASRALEKAMEVLEWKSAKESWQRRRGRLLEEKVDVTRFVCDILTNCHLGWTDLGADTVRKHL
jgi:predicted glycosyltransferase